MRSFALAILTAFLPVIVFAQQVTVRAGEHGDFTRLVFNVPVGTQWELEQEAGANQMRLVLRRDGLKFDTSRVFQKIDNSRISGFEPVNGQSALDILLNCNCAAESFVLRNRMIVLDFRGADADVVTAQPEPEKPITTEANLPYTAQDISLARELSKVRVAGIPGVGPSKQPEPLLPSVSILRPENQQIEKVSNQPKTTDPYEVGDSIAEDLARAATQGLLDPAVQAAPDPRHITLHPEEQGLEDNGSDAEAHSADLFEQLAEINPDSAKKGVISIGGIQCTSDKKLRIAEWGQADSILEVLARDRSQLFGEFDKVNDRALQDYVRALLHFGFGAEARAVLSATPEHPDPMLQAISYMVDGEKEPTGWFLKQANCDTNAAFWAALSGGVKPEDTHYNSQAILRGLEALPVHLREFLGPQLANRLSLAGKSDLARDVLRRLERLHGGATASLALNEAQLELREGNIEKADTTLKSIQALPGAAAPSAITTAVDIARAKDQSVSGEVVALTAAYASELRDSEQGPELWQAHIRSRLLNRQFPEGYEALQDSVGIPAEMVRDTTIEVFKALTAQAEDVEFLKFAMGGMLHSEDLGNPSLDLAIIQRLLDLDMAEAALDRLDTTPEKPGAHEFRLARARALLALSRPEEAEIVLVGLRGEKISELRAEARRQMGDFDYARNIYEEMGQSDDALNAAWLSGDWERVAQEGENPLAQAARLTEATAPAPEAPSLGYAEGLTGESAQTRETIRALLEATRIGAGN
ncbi:hypothetical protein [Primorskyibacter sp. 2E233]|uniref:hypothetical protein n=1 Tax=Primorskyibacter sp. 2E233 TaxID=3413431 RepID=UPI003BF3E6D6